MTRVLAVSAVFPPHRHQQAEIAEELARRLPPAVDPGLLRRVHASVGVDARHLALPLDRYGRLDGFGQCNDIYLELARDLGTRAVRAALEEAAVAPEEVDVIVSTSVTGIATPSLDARLAAEAGLRPDVRRVPLFGLGCAGGAAGTARLHDLLAGRPGDVGLLLSVELCSLTLQPADTSMANLVSGALFGDGAAALVAVGAEHPRHPGRTGGVTAGHTFAGRPGPVVVDCRSRLHPGTEQLLGWHVGEWGLRPVLGSELPDVVRLHVGEEIGSFLAEHDLKPRDVAAWVCHPGGPKVLDVLADVLGLPEDALSPSRRSLARAGNLSSASVLHILRDALADGPPEPGAPGLMLAFGPGFSSELVLLRW
ncbi:type III polyketide synthase [Streptomyces sp. NPDC058991]|uniref:type III polyketide synthase n=1 Tax=unclassified Streptomyces TaxID=2593676 RepID=UPI0036C51567